MAPNVPESYNTWALPGLILAHHPESSAAVTPVVIVKLHRPADRNGFTDELSQALITAFDTLSVDPRVKCVVLTSSDPTNKMFCAGMDFNAKHRMYPSYDTHRDSGGQLTLAMYRCNKPIIAAINGSAVGIGMTMTLPCNIRVASNKAKVGFVFSRRGFNMEACSSFFLPRLIGTAKALHLTTTGAVYPADHKLLDDLFSEVVDPDQVLPTALAIAEDTAKNTSIVASRINKDLMYRGPSTPEEAHLLESKVFYDLARNRDSQEGVQSFLQKRAPDFQGTIEEDSPTVYPWWTPIDVRETRPKL
ncbi:unnamed protein product [Clonostachys rosea f. rosea IK726]|jgi:enoyl-CoA hydratase/carnithine racemase|uniref:Enoyl-CoA hydratase n=2 Tax=Bionectria ochroleuca TaxID=29856 RepID=A0A0B7K2R5_BIOOC|nr:unnamed protein product [Clonostachys rosea f. rosea IK726]